MLDQLTKFLYPSTIEEAVEALVKARGNALPLAGGTSVALARNAKIKVLVDITRIGLDRIDVHSDHIEIQACATAHGIAASGLTNLPEAGGLVDAAMVSGPSGVRAAMTMGGSLAQCYPWSDPPVALLALDVEIEINGASKRTVNITKLLERHPSKGLKTGDLITTIVVPRSGGASAFLKQGLTVTDDALASAAVSLHIDRGQKGRKGKQGQVGHDGTTRLSALRLALGGLRPLPILATGLDDLVGRPIDHEWFETLADRIRQQVQPTEDARAPIEYRRKLAGVLAKRAVQKALDRSAQQARKDR